MFLQSRAEVFRQIFKKNDCNYQTVCSSFVKQLDSVIIANEGYIE